MGDVDIIISEKNARLETIQKLRASEGTKVTELINKIKSEAEVGFCQRLDITKLVLDLISRHDTVLKLAGEEVNVLTGTVEKLSKLSGGVNNESMVQSDEYMTQSEEDKFRERVSLKIAKYKIDKEHNPKVAPKVYSAIFAEAKGKSKTQKQEIVKDMLRDEGLLQSEEEEDELEEIQE